jgi:uncharacterized protein (DUF1330 family)
MSAFMIFHVTVNDPEKFQVYGQSVGPTLPPFGGSVAKRGKMVNVMAGSHDRKNVAILTFPDHASAEGWYNSPAYQALIPNRDEAADMTSICYEEPRA